MSSPTIPDGIDQGTLDWAHSMQARHAEHVMGKLARQRDGGPMDPAFRHQIRGAAVAAGIDPTVIVEMIDRPVLEKLTTFDEPDVRSSSAALVDMLTKTMRDATMDVGDRALLVWSLATGQINALCAANSWDPTYYHIFVDPDLLVFSNMLGKLVAECLTREKAVEGDTLNLMQVEANVRSPEIQRRAADLFSAAILKGTARASKPWLPSPEAYNYAQQISLGLNLFPLAHELGHLHLRHVEAPGTKTVAVEELADFLLYAHDDEYQADIVGAIVTVETLIRLKMPGMFNCLAPYIFLKGVETLEACSEIFGMAGEMSATHPSPTDRARNMRGLLHAYLESKKATRLYAQALRAVDRIFHWLLFSAFLHLQERKAAGDSPRPRLRLTVVEYEERIEAEWQARSGSDEPADQ
jgi:hypothetical protein